MDSIQFSSLHWKWWECSDLFNLIFGVSFYIWQSLWRFYAKLFLLMSWHDHTNIGIKYYSNWGKKGGDWFSYLHKDEATLVKGAFLYVSLGSVIKSSTWASNFVKYAYKLMQRITNYKYANPGVQRSCFCHFTILIFDFSLTRLRAYSSENRVRNGYGFDCTSLQRLCSWFQRFRCWGSFGQVYLC